MIGSRILIVVAHPDDEVLGMGGTMVRHADDGDEVYPLFITDGVTARDPQYDFEARKEDIFEREDMARRAAEILGARPPRFLRLPDNRMDGIELIDIAKMLEQVIAELSPDTVYTNNGTDLNIDHRLTHQAVLTACRPQPGAPVRRIHTFETLSSTEWGGEAIGRAFRPNRFVDVGAYVERKLEALSCYAQEMREFPHSRSVEAVEALMRQRGASVGLDAAEAFETVRDIWGGGTRNA